MSSDSTSGRLTNVVHATNSDGKHVTFSTGDAAVRQWDGLPESPSQLLEYEQIFSFSGRWYLRGPMRHELIPQPRFRQKNIAAREITQEQAWTWLLENGESLPPDLVNVSVGASGEAAGKGVAQKPGAKGKGINERIVTTMIKDPESVGWSIRKWKEHLKCRAISTIQESQAWKLIMTARKTQAADSGASREKEGRRDGRRRAKSRTIED